MDTVLQQINDQEKKTKSKTRKLKTIYDVYHIITKIFLYSILMILILVSICFVIYFVDLQKNIKNGTNKQPLFGAYIIISPSMVPTINVYDAIIIKRTEMEDLKEGDIVTFISNDPRYNGLTITHRITGIEKSQNGEYLFRTKGDNNNTEDSSLVRADDIYGKVILKIPKLGYLQHILTNAFGWVLLIVIPCIGVVIYDIIKILKSITRPRLNSIKNRNLYDNDNDYDENIETIGEQTTEEKDIFINNYQQEIIDNGITENKNDDDIDYL